MPKKAATEPQKLEGRERVTFQLPRAILDRARNAVFFSPELTLAGMVEEGLGKVLDKAEKANGGPFPPRSAKLKRGRPVNK
jgi:hypothetical protein